MTNLSSRHPCQPKNLVSKLQCYKRQWPDRSHLTDQNSTFLIKQRTTYDEINYWYNLPETDIFTNHCNWNLPSSRQHWHVPLLMHQPAVSDQFCYWIGLHSGTFFASDHGSCQENLCRGSTRIFPALHPTPSWKSILEPLIRKLGEVRVPMG